MKSFERPGGVRLVPEPDYLADAETWEAFRARWREATEVLDELEQLDHQLRDGYRDRRRLKLEIHRLRGKARGDGFAVWETEQQREASTLLERKVQEQEELTEEIEALEDEREDLARHIDRRFVGLQVDRDWPDLRPPDEAKVAAQVGQPVRSA